MKNKRKGNDLNVMWQLLHEGEPFRLEGRDITIYLKDSFGKTEVKDFRVSDNIIFWTFYGKDQKHNGRYSLELIINEGETGMITTDVCDFVNLVPHSCMVGGEDSPNVQTETIELTSTLEYVAVGGTVVVDTELSETSENPIANAAVTKALSLKPNKEDIPSWIYSAITIEPLSDSSAIIKAFNDNDLANKLNTPILCFIKKERFDKDYTMSVLVVEDYTKEAGYRLTFTLLGVKSDAKSEDMEAMYSNDVFTGQRVLSYLYNKQYGYITPLGEGVVRDRRIEGFLKELESFREDMKEFLTEDDLREKTKVFEEEIANVDTKTESFYSSFREFVALTLPTEYAKKSDIATPNWEANDRERGYIQNRTHYKQVIGNYNETVDKGLTNTRPSNGLYNVVLVGVGVTFEYVKVDNAERNFYSQSHAYTLHLKDGAYEIIYMQGDIFESKWSGAVVWIKLDVAQLSEVYIPNSIARTAEAKGKQLYSVVANNQNIYISDNVYCQITSWNGSPTIHFSLRGYNGYVTEGFLEYIAEGYAINWDENIVWANDTPPTHNWGSTYQVSVVNNLGVWIEFPRPKKTFFIDGQPFVFLKGDTWRDWFREEYNTIGVSVEESTLRMITADGYLKIKDNYVSLYDFIEVGGSYIVEPFPSNDPTDLLVGEYSHSATSTGGATLGSIPATIAKDSSGNLTITNIFGSSPSISCTFNTDSNILTVKGGWTSNMFGPINEDIDFSCNFDTMTLTTVNNSVTLGGWATITGYTLSKK